LLGLPQGRVGAAAEFHQSGSAAVCGHGIEKITGCAEALAGQRGRGELADRPREPEAKSPGALPRELREISIEGGLALRVSHLLRETLKKKRLLYLSNQAI